MNRADYIRLSEVFRALGAACKEALTQEAQHEWTFNDTRASWPIRDGVTVFATISNQTLVIQDEAVFMKWLAEQHPTEVVTKQVVRNTDWLKARRDQWAGEVAAGRMETPPGTKLDEGGEFRSISSTGTAGVRRHLDVLAAGLLASGVPLSTEELIGIWDSALRAANTVPEEGS